jgi:hypothetical protein
VKANEIGTLSFMSMQPGSLPPPPVSGGYGQPQGQYQFQGHLPHARNEDVLVAVNGSVFPQVCPMCGQAATVQKSVRVQYIPKWARLFGILIASALAKRATLQPWFCQACIKKTKVGQILGLGLIAAAVATLFMVVISGWFALLGFVLLIAAIVVSIRSARLRVKLITKDTVTLKKTHPAFRAILPIAP